jgi:phosphopantetheinyl transferase (holo-ACP synthase)
MKSIEVKFNEAMAAVTKAGRMSQYQEASKTCTNIESKFAAAEDVLKAAGVTRTNESGPISRLTHEQYQVFAKRLGKKPNMTVEEQTILAEGIMSGAIKESTPKNNGAVDNFSESNPLRDFSPGYKETTRTNNPCTKGDKILHDYMLQIGQINEAEHRKLIGLKPVEYDALTEVQKKEFDFSPLIGISESDSFKLVKMTGNTLKEVSRR